MVVVDASVLVNALLLNGAARARLTDANPQAPDLIDAELLSVLRRLVLADQLPEPHALQALATACPFPSLSQCGAQQPHRLLLHSCPMDRSAHAPLSAPVFTGGTINMASLSPNTPGCLQRTSVQLPRRGAPQSPGWDPDGAAPARRWRYAVTPLVSSDRLV